MKVFIHAGTLRGFGSGVVGRSLIEEMASAEGAHTIAACIPESWERPPSLGGRIKALYPVKAGVFAKFHQENMALRKHLRTFRADRLLSLTDTSLLKSPIPHALLVQQAYLAYDLSRWRERLPLGFRRKLSLMDGYMRLGLRHVDCVTVQTEHMKAAFAERWQFSPERIRVIPSAIQPAASECAQGGPVIPDDSPPYVMYVAGPGGLKNHRVLAPMMASLAQRHPELRCKLTVRREDVDALVSAAIRLDCIDRFDFLGPTPSQTTMALLARAQVSVMPSLLESFGIPYFEALALGVPSVGADVPCAREALGEAGRFAQPDSGESWAECVNEILTDRDLFVNQSLARHHSRPTWSEVAARYLQMLREL